MIHGIYRQNVLFRWGFSGEKVFGAALRLQGNESPGGAFKQASGLRQQMEGPCPDKRRGRHKHESYKIKMPPTAFLPSAAFCLFC